MYFTALFGCFSAIFFYQESKKHVKVWYSDDQQTVHRDFCAPRHNGIAKIDSLCTTVATLSKTLACVKVTDGTTVRLVAGLDNALWAR